MTNIRAIAVLACASAAGLYGQPLAAQVPAAEQQIRAALLAAPADRSEGATVLGYTESGALVTLRRGSNDLVCVADNPTDERFEVVCYHESLEPYMARGRELAAQGVQDRNAIRWKEADDGLLPMPAQPATLYILHGASKEAYDTVHGEVRDGYTRWVIYIPWATEASTGLSTRPIENGPWIMDPGTAGAHIMLVPPRRQPGG